MPRSEERINLKIELEIESSQYKDQIVKFIRSSERGII
jgi:hypothetical protein